MVYEVLRYLRDLDYEYVYPRASRPVEGAEGSAAGAGAPNTELGASPASRAIALSEAAQEAAGCEACALAGQRKNVVFGSGNANAELMFVGEGPGAHEDAKGLPFVGPAGELLTRIIEAIDLTREEVYIANIVKCRPPGNRDPLPAEVAACRAFLERQIDLVQPKIVVALGRVAAQTLLGSDLSLGRMRGEWHEFRGAPLRVTYHPAALLRSQQYKRPTWEDMKIVRARLVEDLRGPSTPVGSRA